MRRALPILCRAAAAALGLAVMAAGLRQVYGPMPAIAGQTVPLAQSSQREPLTLGDKPVSVTLAPSPETPGSLQSRVGALAPSDQLYLVLQGLRADQPVGTGYQVYLDLPAGTAPARDGGHYVGDLNFFNAAPGRRSAMFNVTSLLQALRSHGGLSDHPTVTIAPNDPAAGRAATAVIANIALIAVAP